MWIVVGSGADTQLVETDKGVPYEDAKRTAIEKMERSLQPVLGRLEEIKQDIDLEKNKKPGFKAWHCYRTMVVARTCR
jgi:hypothetical protein